MALTASRLRRQAASSTAGRPAVNLLPPEVVERARARRVAKAFASAGGVVLLAGAAVWWAQAGAITSAENELGAAQAASAAAQAQIEPLNPYGEFAAAIERQEQTIADAMSSQLSFGSAFEAFEAAWPAGTTTRSMSLDTTTTCPGPDPFTPDEGLACLTFGVTVTSQVQAEQLMAALENAPALVDPFLTSADVTDAGVEVNGTVNLAPDLLTRRYDQPAEEAAP